MINRLLETILLLLIASVFVSFLHGLFTTDTCQTKGYYLPATYMFCMLSEKRQMDPLEKQVREQLCNDLGLDGNSPTSPEFEARVESVVNILREQKKRMDEMLANAFPQTSVPALEPEPIKYQDKGYLDYYFNIYNGSRHHLTIHNVDPGPPPCTHKWTHYQPFTGDAIEFCEKCDEKRPSTKQNKW